MLKQRVLTALILVTVLTLALLSTAPWVFPALVLVFMLAGAWEWGRMNGCSQVLAIWTSCELFIIIGLTWYLGWLNQSHPLLWVIASGLWVLVGGYLLKNGSVAWLKLPQTLRRYLGVMALWLVWLALCQARMIGINFLMSALFLVWSADTFAYFAGRTWGGKFTQSKLAPSISPGKSWEGVWGGMVGVMVVAGIWMVADQKLHADVASLFTRLSEQNWLILLLGLIFMTTMSVVGDLIESLIKRSAGVKDSSQLLPGHGGVLDRIDAILPTLPIAMMLVSLLS
ncbi:MAG TPA: phosphatidate cytidylyltransferase [Burkholderiaceae bacterium]|nr:phosphatidate cytidylyltransferase [Burkholderiaceae bacterium]